MDHQELLIYLLIIIGIMIFFLSYGKLINLVDSFASWLEIRKNQCVANELREAEKRSRVKTRKIAEQPENSEKFKGRN